MQPIWQPSRERVEAANLSAFMRAVEAQWPVSVGDYEALYRWSIDEPEPFWSSLWSFVDVRCARRGEAVLVDAERMPGARFFPDARLNFAENLLRRRDPAPALIFRGEDRVSRSLSFAGLYSDVSRLREQLGAWGVRAGDRVAGYLPNMPEAVVAMLATTSLGAIWSSCSPDFGVEGALDRFGQIAPVVLFAADGYRYAGRWHDSRARIDAIRARLPSLRGVVIAAYEGGDGAAEGVPGAVDYARAIEAHPAAEIEFEAFPFDHPLYVLFSSGTTGAPKCIVHGAGGALLQHLKEHRLHVDLKPGDRFFYFTTCGWMMWNWLVSGLASEATLLLYDGSPLHPDPGALFDFAASERARVFGASAKYIDALAKAGLEPVRTHDLASLETMLSTGSPLVAESYDYVYSKIKRDLCLSSISGGTDILSCFVGGNPIGPVWRGEIQARCLGVRVEVYDESGRPVIGEKGELVCSAPIPSMPIGFWNDPDGASYRAAYFERFPGVWCQGDFALINERGGAILYGRSDAVLNPGGVRIGTAEIYRQVEQIDEVLESLAIGQQWQGDLRVVLFVRLREGVELDTALVERIRARIREQTTPRHVPARVIQVADIPRTRSGKIVELAVRDVVHGRAVRNREALANPEALDLFAALPELQS
ncbi:MAG TPA: acetoacetate--CoA ligase [Myxococcota bacterium]|nr:acetoacetate--CoA ligase [Myxococcota bacterium]